MPATSTYPKQKIAITFPITQLSRAREKAKKELGFNIPELIRHLVADYLTRGFYRTCVISNSKKNVHRFFAWIFHPYRGNFSRKDASVSPQATE